MLMNLECVGDGKCATYVYYEHLTVRFAMQGVHPTPRIQINLETPKSVGRAIATGWLDQVYLQAFCERSWEPKKRDGPHKGTVG